LSNDQITKMLAIQNSDIYNPFIDNLRKPET